MKRVISLIAGLAMVVAAVLPAVPVRAQSQKAILFLSPASGSYDLNKTFTVKVMVNSGGGTGINAADGVIGFDKSRLSVVNVSDSGTIFSLWTTNPTFSNGDGTITFGGGSPSAYKGTAGTIFTVTFKAQNTGEAAVDWKSGIVLAADGKGTDVSGGFGNAKFTIKEAAPAPAVETKPTETKPAETEGRGIKPPTPEVSSDTHPKSDVWYQGSRPEFGWKVLSDLTGVSYAVTAKPEDDPGDHADGIVEQTTIDHVDDGEWYFHIKFKNRYGWGNTSHYRFLVDSTAPSAFGIAVDNEGDATNPSPKLLFRSEDKTSGIDHYELVINSNKTIISPAEMAQGYYRPGLMAPGNYLASVTVFDKAENSASSSVNFIIDPLKAPIITDAPGVISRREQLIVQGTSFYPRVDIKVYVSCNGKDAIESTVQTDDQNNWSYFHEGDLDKGRCEIWAKVVDERGAESLNSSKHLLTVESPSIVESFGLIIIIILLLVIALLIGYIFFQHHRFIMEKTRILSETREVKSKLSKIFSALREEVDELIELADKRPGLSDSERRVKEKLQESLDISEEFIAKEVEDVEKEIKLKKSNFE